MLPKRKKLRSDDFKEKRAVLKKKSSPFFSINFYSQREKEARFAIVVGSKVTKNKPQRNLLKRRVYEVIRDIIKKRSIGEDVIIYPKKEAISLDYKAISIEISRLL